MSDERLSLTSGSKFGALVSCPGKEQAENALPNKEDVSDEYAARGIRVHDALLKSNPSDLDEEETELYNTALRSDEKILAQWAQDNALTEFFPQPKELRLWLHDGAMRPIGSGQLDCHWRSGEHLAIIDYKSGYAPHVPPAEKSWQMRFYACLAWKEYPDVKRIRVALNLPQLNRTDCCDYTVEDLQMAEAGIRYHVWEASLPDAPRRPGSQCNFCRAKDNCPEAAAFSLLPSVIARAASPSAADISAAVNALAPADLVRVWQASAVVGKIQDAVKARLKGFSDEDLAALGIERGKARVTRNIDAVEAAFDFMAGTTNVPKSALFSAMKFSNTELAKVLRREVGMSAEGAPAWIKETLALWISEKESEAPLQLIK